MFWGSVIVSLCCFYVSHPQNTHHTRAVSVCYGKNFGPRGYGFGQGAGTLQSDTYQNE